MVVEVLRKGVMDALDFVTAVLASSVSVGCLSMVGWSVWYGLRPDGEDETQSLYLLGALVCVPPAILFGFYGCAEAWVFVVTVTALGSLFLWMRSGLEKVN